MSNNWMPPQSEQFLQWEALMQNGPRQLRAERPDADDDALAEAILADPKITALSDALKEEFCQRLVEQVIDSGCFIFTTSSGEKRVIGDEELLHMSDRELVAWAQKT